MLQSNKPKILVSGSRDATFISDLVARALQGQARNTIARLEALGSDVRFLDASSGREKAESALDGIAGLLVLGGADISPALYGARPETDTLYGVNQLADEHEAALVAGAADRGIPFLGICRGMQLLNVVRGGSLTQHLGDDSTHTASAENEIMTWHTVDVLKGTRLSAIVGTPRLNVLSGHHQAINRLGQDLRVTAKSPDGVIEAVESSVGPWCVGVQWHPEDPAAPVEELDRLLAAFLSACD